MSNTPSALRLNEMSQKR